MLISQRVHFIDAPFVYIVTEIRAQADRWLMKMMLI